MLVTELFEALPQTGDKTVLVAGSGPDSLPDWVEQGYKPVRLDIEPRTNPDIVASMTAMGDIGPYDVVFCSHALEHLYPHEVYQALTEFLRVLKPGGTAVIMVPDLEDVRPTEDILTGFPNNNKLCGLHLYYGDFEQIAEFPYMAHHCGFIADTLKHALEVAGFKFVRACRLAHYNLMGIGVKGE
jgi:SAM-dependent methyltransferase